MKWLKDPDLMTTVAGWEAIFWFVAAFPVMIWFSNSVPLLVFVSFYAIVRTAFSMWQAGYAGRQQTEEVVQRIDEVTPDGG